MKTILNLKQREVVLCKQLIYMYGNKKASQREVSEEGWALLGMVFGLGFHYTKEDFGNGAHLYHDRTLSIFKQTR